MTPQIAMPLLRQLPRDPDRPLAERLRQWRAPVVYELAEDYTLAARVCGRWLHLYLPAGFRTDLASTPRLSWLFGGRPDGLLLIPGLYHDWYYRHGTVETRVGMQYSPGRWSVPAGDCTRAWGDKLFRDLAQEIGGLRLPAYAAWAALRAFGGIAWRANEPYRRAYRATNTYQLEGEYGD